LPAAANVHFSQGKDFLISLLCSVPRIYLISHLALQA
jgi:hypothetical protein